MTGPNEHEGAWSEERLAAFERSHPAGLGVREIVDAFEATGEPLTEATFRKYVQLGLLPRSVRVARGGKSRGSQGLYPATVIRRIETIRRLMSQGYTIEEIQTEFFFIRGDIEELSRSLGRVYAGIERALEGARAGDFVVRRKYEEVRQLGDALLAKLDEIEQRASLLARLERAQV